MPRKAKTAKRKKKSPAPKRSRKSPPKKLGPSVAYGLFTLVALGVAFIYHAFSSKPVSQQDLVELRGTLKDWFISGSNYPSDQFFLKEFPRAAFSVDKAAFDLLISEDHLRPGAKFTISVKKLDMEGLERGIAGILPQDVSVYALALGENTYLSLLESNDSWNTHRQVHLVFGLLLLLLASTIRWAHFSPASHRR